MNPVQILLAIAGISILVIIHEAGHYLAARAFGMRVLKFSVGFGPALIRYQPKNSPTVFQVCAVPFLAYVQIAGMNPAEQIDPNDRAYYPNQGLLARMVTIFAGPLANYVTASALVFTMAVSGWPEEIPLEPVQVARVSPGSPAAKAGILPGDLVIRAQNQPVKNMKDLIAVTGPRAKQDTLYVVRRGGKELSFKLRPQLADKRGVIGIVAQTRRVYHYMSVGKAAKAAVIFPYELTVAQLKELGNRIRAGSTEGVSGPWGMGKMVAEQAKQGFLEYVWILMVLSVALGLFNLLPVPALDGGRLVFLVYELITRRRPNERFEAMVHAVGLVLLLTLLVFVTIRDVAG